MAGNGDERQMATWERVEAKLDRLLERRGEHDEVLAQHSEVLTKRGELLAEHSEILARLDRRLSRVEDAIDLVKLMLKGVRHEIEDKIARLRDDLLAVLGRETRIELMATQTINENRIVAIERRLDALEAKA